MVEKGTRGGICHSNYRYAEANNKYMKDHDTSKESSYLMYWDINNLYEKAMSQKLPVGGFDLVKSTSQFEEDLIINHKENGDIGYIL